MTLVGFFSLEQPNVSRSFLLNFKRDAARLSSSLFRQWKVRAIFEKDCFFHLFLEESEQQWFKLEKNCDLETWKKMLEKVRFQNCCAALCYVLTDCFIRTYFLLNKGSKLLNHYQQIFIHLWIVEKSTNTQMIPPFYIQKWITT